MSFRSFLPFTPENVNNFQLTLSEMIQYSAGLISVGTDGEQFQNEYVQRAIIAANLAMLEMQAKGLIITSYRVGYLFVTQGQHTYVVEDEHSTNEYSQNQISVAAVTGDNTFTLQAAGTAASIETILPGDYVGLTLDTGNLFWTTCASFSSPTLVTVDSIPSDIGVGQYVLNYTNTLKQISRVHQIWRRDNYITDVPINMISQQEYDVLPFKFTTQGLSSQAYYKRAIPKGILELWSVPQNSESIFGFWYESKLGQLKNMTDVIDLDQFYYPAFTYLLATRLCDVFAVDPMVKKSIGETASVIMAEALSYDDEMTPVKISPNRRI